MNVEQIVSLGPELADFMDEFADCFGRSEPRSHMAQYIRGQLSELPRKSVEPIALAAVTLAAFREYPAGVTGLPEIKWESGTN